jgi:hypothetical protein
MRSLFLLVTAALAACSTPAEQARQEARGEAKLQQHLAGRVAGQPQSCLPSFRTQDMVRVDDNTILFRDGSKTIYRNETLGRCSGLGSSNYTLVTRTVGAGGRLCSGDLASVVDIQTGSIVGGCALGEFVPYTRSSS